MGGSTVPLLPKDKSEGCVKACCQRNTTRKDSEMLLSADHLQEIHTDVYFLNLHRWAGEVAQRLKVKLTTKNVQRIFRIARDNYLENCL